MPMSGSGARLLGLGLEPAGPGGESAAAPARRRCATRLLDGCAGPSTTRAGGDPPVRRAGARRRRAERSRPGRAVRAVRGARRSGAVDAVGQPERVGAASAAGGAASRGVGRREVLRHARPHLAGSGALHRSDGTAISGPGVRVHRASTRCRSAATSSSPSCSTTSIARSASHRGPAGPDLSLQLARPGGSTQPADPLRAVVGGRSRPRWPFSPSHSPVYYARLGDPRPIRCRRRSRRSASKIFAVPPPRRAACRDRR